MLVRIDVYDGSEADDDPQRLQQPTATLHTCLSTRTHELGNDASKKGLMMVGRKAGDITFPTDKSVSRQHCTLQLVRPQCETDAAPLVAAAPSNKEEEDACEDSELGMCIVLQGHGKGGCFVAVAAEDFEDGANDNQDASADSDSDTDEEGTSQMQKNKQMRQQRKAKSSGATNEPDDLPPIAAVVSRGWAQTTASLELRKVDANESFILPLEQSYKNAATPSTVFVQCGRAGSMFAITWIPMRISFSRISPPLKVPALKKMLPRLGATTVPQDVPNLSADAPTTHLVTSEVVGGGKQIIAWNYMIPTVSPDFLQALLDRKAASDPLTSESDHPAQRTANGDFWDQQPNQQLLNGFALLSLKNDESEELVRSAGAEVIALHTKTDMDALAYAKELLGAENAVHSKRKPIYFALSSTKKLTKAMERIGIPIVTTKAIAKSIGKQACELKDKHGNLLEAVIDDGGDDADADVAKTNATIKAEDGADAEAFIVNAADHGDDEMTDVEVDAVVAKVEEEDDEDGDKPSKTKMGHSQAVSLETEASPPQEQVLPKPSRRTKMEDAPAEQQQQAESNSDRGANTGVDDESMGQAQQRKQKRKRTMDANSDNEDDTRVRKEARSRTQSQSRSHPSSSSSNATATSRIRRENSNTTAKVTGWFTIAPKDDRERKQLRKTASKQYARDNGGFEFQPSAVTEKVQLPQRKTAEAANKQDDATSPSSSTAEAAAGTTASGRRRRQGPNFSRFRKNHVPTCPSRTSNNSNNGRSSIRMREVLPQEPKIQSDMVHQNQELEVQQRMADELFRDTGAGPRTVKRRRRQ